MKILSKNELEAAWRRVDDRFAALKQRYLDKSDVPLYTSDRRQPASVRDLVDLEAALGLPVPQEIAYSLMRSNGCEVAHDHAISLASVREQIFFALQNAPIDGDESACFEFITGPVNPLFFSKKRYFFGTHNWSGTSLYLDYENPPEGGQLGQVIRVGEGLDVAYVASSFVEFLNLIANAPCADDDPDFDPLQWRP